MVAKKRLDVKVWPGAEPNGRIRHFWHYGRGQCGLLRESPCPAAAQHFGRRNLKIKLRKAAC